MTVTILLPTLLPNLTLATSTIIDTWSLRMLNFWTITSFQYVTDHLHAQKAIPSMS